MLKAQNFGDNNPVWNYSANTGWGPFQLHVQLSIKKDTLFNNKQCKILDPRGRVNDSFMPYKNMICADSAKVTFWSPTLSEFQTLYDFEAKKGDVWKSRSDDFYSNSFFNIYIAIDSVYMQQVNNQLLQVQRIRIFKNDTINWKTQKPYYYSVFETIGCTKYLFPWLYGYVDAGRVTGLRCFEDGSLGFFQFDNSVACDYTQVGLEEPQTALRNPIFPNPNNGRFLVSAYSGLSAVRVFDVQGKLVFEQRIADCASNELEVDLDRQLSGLFFVEVVDKAGEITRQKMVLRR